MLGYNEMVHICGRCTGMHGTGVNFLWLPLRVSAMYCTNIFYGGYIVGLECTVTLSV
jgi:hypothetical protein